MQQEEKQQSVKQKTLGAFFKMQTPAAAPPPTVQKEGFSVDHLYGASGAALYQKSKLQREAQLAAYPMKVAEAPESRSTLQF